MAIHPTEIPAYATPSPADINPRCSDWRLSIDKLSIVESDPIPARVQKVCDAIVGQVKSRRWLGAILSSSRRFQLQASIPIRGTDQRLLFQGGRRGTNHRDYRIEVNPALLNNIGVERVIDLLDEILPDGGEHFIRGGVVTRIDLALDLNGLSADDVVVRSRRQQVHGVFSNRNGVPETHYFGRPKNNNTCVYTKSNDEGLQSLRIERRLIPKCFGAELQCLQNPFRAIEIVHVDAFHPHLDGLVPEHLFDSFRIRGFNHVVKALPSKQRKALTAVLKDPAKSLLPAMDEVWGRWREILANSGLGFLLNRETIEAGSPLTTAKTVECL